MTRDPARVAAAAAAANGGSLRVVRSDAVTGEGLELALAGGELAYYLIPSMEPEARGGSIDGFVERERLAAQHFATAAREAGVRRIVYLGGLVPRWEQRSGRGGGRERRS